MSTNAQRLGRAVAARRFELGLSQVEVATNGGPSNTKQTEVENGRLEKLTNLMARRLETGLSWEPGSARRVWDGRGEATPRGATTEPKDGAWLRDRIEEADRVPVSVRARLIGVLDETEGVSGR